MSYLLVPVETGYKKVSPGYVDRSSEIKETLELILTSTHECGFHLINEDSIHWTIGDIKNSDNIKKYTSLDNLNFRNEKLCIAITKDKEYLLSLADNWDEENSKGYKEQTIYYAIDFLAMLLNHLSDTEVEKLATETHLLPAGEGSVDLYRVSDNFELLIVFRENRSVSYYGESRNNVHIVKGEEIPIPEDIAYWVKICGG